MRPPTRHTSSLTALPVEAVWNDCIITYYGISVYIGNAALASFMCEFDDPEEFGTGDADGQPTEACFLELRVHENHRRQGNATRLVGALAAACAQQSITRLHGAVESPLTIKIFNRLFPDRVSYHDFRGGARVELPMTDQQAIASLERMQQADIPPLDDSLSVSINLERLAVGTGCFIPPTFDNTRLAS